MWPLRLGQLLLVRLTMEQMNQKNRMQQLHGIRIAIETIEDNPGRDGIDPLLVRWWSLPPGTRIPSQQLRLVLR